MIPDDTPADRAQLERWRRDCESLRGLIREAEDGRHVRADYDGLPPDLVEESLRATRARLARIEALLAAAEGGDGASPGD